MTEITTHIKEDIDIDKKTTLIGMITGNVSIKNSADFIVNGTVNGNVTIENNSSIIVHGTINGNINNAGRCKVYGTVAGKIIDNGGMLEIDPKAKVN